MAVLHSGRSTLLSTQSDQPSTGPGSLVIHSRDDQDALVPVTMVDVWIVGVAMRQHLVPVRVIVRLSAVPLHAVLMLVVFVMHMTVHVLQRLVRVHVLVSL